MSDMSFNQAKELVERMEFSEIAIKRASDNLEKSTKNFELTLKQQENILNKIPHSEKKISYMIVGVGVNVGFILGLIVGKYLL